MFTGLIEEVGTIQSVRHGARSCVLTIGCRTVLEGSQIGDSIAVNGVCLTVTSMGGSYYTADVMAETMNRSSLGQLSGTGDACKWQIWGTYRIRSYRWDRNRSEH